MCLELPTVDAKTKAIANFVQDGAVAGMSPLAAAHCFERIRCQVIVFLPLYSHENNKLN